MFKENKFKKEQDKLNRMVIAGASKKAILQQSRKVDKLVLGFYLRQNVSVQ